MSTHTDITTIDTLISGATIVTMNEERHLIKDGAIAIDGDLIVSVGKSSELSSIYNARTKIDGRHFVITPGFVDAHIHITGDPLTRGVRRGAPGAGFTENLAKFVIPLFQCHDPQDEKISAQFVALRMLKAGVTSFIEAGTILDLDTVVEGLNKLGIRGRVGQWVEGRSFDDAASATIEIDKAIKGLENEVKRYGQTQNTRVSAWPLLIGHTMNPDEVWMAAKRLADDSGLHISAHMSPYATDTEWFLANTGKRPIEHLADLGVLGENVLLTHVNYIHRHELDILVDTGTQVVFCPYAAIGGAFGVSSRGLYPEMAKMGVNLMLGTDGIPVDILNSARLMSGLLRDARMDETLFPATETLEMITINGARGMGMSQQLGVIEAGRKADLVCHDTRQAHWFPEFDIIDQLVHSSAGADAHSVWVDGERVIENYQSTKIDEKKLIAEAREHGAAVVARAGVPIHHPWPVI